MAPLPDFFICRMNSAHAVYALTITIASGSDALIVFTAPSTLTVFRSTVPLEWICMPRLASAISVPLRPASP